MSAAEFLPVSRDIESLRRAAGGCRGCELWRRGTQTVFGEGAVGAAVMLVGEQPGDQEDRSGRPFVGPAFSPASPPPWVADLAPGSCSLSSARWQQSSPSTW